MWNERRKELQINDIITTTTTIILIITTILNNKNWFAESGAPSYNSNICVGVCIGLEHWTKAISQMAKPWKIFCNSNSNKNNAKYNILLLNSLMDHGIYCEKNKLDSKTNGSIYMDDLPPTTNGLIGPIIWSIIDIVICYLLSSAIINTKYFHITMSHWHFISHSLSATNLSILQVFPFLHHLLCLLALHATKPVFDV